MAARAAAPVTDFRPIIYYWLDIDNGKFYEQIAASSVFAKRQATLGERPIDGLYSYQDQAGLFAGYVMGRTLLIWAGVGTGKTMMAFAAAERMLAQSALGQGLSNWQRYYQGYVRNIRKVYYVTPNPMLGTQAAQQLICLGLGEQYRQRYIAEGNRIVRVQWYNILDKYEFVTYEGLVAQLAKCRDNSDMVREQYDYSLFIFDEIQFARNTERSRYQELHRLLSTLEHSFSIFMTGSTIINTLDDMRSVINLLNYDKPPVGRDELRSWPSRRDAIEVYRKYLGGRMSYIRPISPQLIPAELTNHTDADVGATLRVELSPQQSSFYNTVKSEDQGQFHQSTLDAALLGFPAARGSRLDVRNYEAFYQRVDSNTGTTRNGKTMITSRYQPTAQLKRVVKENQLDMYSAKYAAMFDAISAGYTKSPRPPAWVAGETVVGMRVYYNKQAWIALRTTTSKPAFGDPSWAALLPGEKVIIFQDRIDGPGDYAVAAILLAMGYEEYSGDRDVVLSASEEVNAKRSQGENILAQFCAAGGTATGPRQGFEPKPRFAFFTGAEGETYRRISALWNASFDRHGAYLQVAILSEKTGVGLNLFNTMQIHLPRPIWEPGVEQQGVGRAFRGSQGHEALLEDMRKLYTAAGFAAQDAVLQPRIYRWEAVLHEIDDNNNTTIDNYVYSASTVKNADNSQFTAPAKIVAWDNPFNRARNVLPSAGGATEGCDVSAVTYNRRHGDRTVGATSCDYPSLATVPPAADWDYRAEAHIPPSRPVEKIVTDAMRDGFISITRLAELLPGRVSSAVLSAQLDSRQGVLKTTDFMGRDAYLGVDGQQVFLTQDGSRHLANNYYINSAVIERVEGFTARPIGPLSDADVARWLGYSAERFREVRFLPMLQQQQLLEEAVIRNAQTAIDYYQWFIYTDEDTANKGTYHLFQGMLPQSSTGHSISSTLGEIHAVRQLVDGAWIDNNSDAAKNLLAPLLNNRDERLWPEDAGRPADVYGLRVAQYYSEREQRGIWIRRIWLQEDRQSAAGKLDIRRGRRGIELKNVPAPTEALDVALAQYHASVDAGLIPEEERERFDEVVANPPSTEVDKRWLLIEILEATLDIEQRTMIIDI